MQQSTRNPKLTFIVVGGASHFDVLAPVNALAASQLAKGELALTAADAQRACDPPALVVNDPAGWSVTLPPGFRKMESKEGHSLFRSKNAVVMLQRLPGSIDRDCGEASALKHDFTVFKVKWGALDICGMRMTTRKDSTELVVLVLQFPVAPRAVNLQRLGPVTEESELRALAKQIAATMKAPTTWK